MPRRSSSAPRTNSRLRSSLIRSPSTGSTCTTAAPRAHRPRPEPRPRRLFRPRRGQPHPEIRRAESPLGRRPAGRRHRRRSVLLVHDGSPSSGDLISVGADDARCQSRPRPGCRRAGRRATRLRSMAFSIATAIGPARSDAKSKSTPSNGQFRTRTRPPRPRRTLRTDYFRPPPGAATERAGPGDRRPTYVLAHAHCPVFLAAAPLIPAEVAD